MIIEKTYDGNLEVGEKIVSINTDHNWAGIEIDFVGKIGIKSLLPDDYIVKAGKNKIIIIKFNKRLEPVSEIFEYKGKLNITSCIICTKQLETKQLHINSCLQLWNTLIKTYKKGKEASVQKDWASLGENWEDLDFDGNNDKRYYTYRKQVYDKDSKTYTSIKERRSR